MMFRQQSAGDRASARPMWPAEATRLRCNKGTSLGREVVPLVCNRSATSSDAPGPGDEARPGIGASGSRRKLPAPLGRSACTSTIGTPSRAATAREGESSPASMTSAFGVRSPR